MKIAIILYGNFGDITLLCALSNTINFSQQHHYFLITQSKFKHFADEYGSFTEVLPFIDGEPYELVEKVNSLKIDRIVDLHNSSYNELKYIEWINHTNISTLVIPKKRSIYLVNKKIIIDVTEDRSYIDRHNAEYYLNRLNRSDIVLKQNMLRISANDDDISKEAKIRSSYHMPLVGIVANSMYPHKEWNIKNWQAITSYLSSKKLIPVYICADFEVQKINAFSNPYPIFSASRLEEYVAYILSTQFVVSIDTGLKHLAAYLGKNVISLYGHSSPNIWGTLSSNEYVIQSKLFCSPCNNPFKCIAETADCVDQISIDNVISKINVVLKDN